MLPQYASKKNELTDGVTGSFYESKTWVGFSGNEPFDITIDLGSIREDVSAFSLHSYSMRESEIMFPRLIIVSVSSDKKEWTEVGRMYAPRDTEQRIFTFSLELTHTVKARYVEFSVADTDCRAILIDEVTVYAYGKKSTTKNKYLAPSDDILGGVEDLFLVYHNQSLRNNMSIPLFLYFFLFGLTSIVTQQMMRRKQITLLKKRRSYVKMTAEALGISVFGK